MSENKSLSKADSKVKRPPNLSVTEPASVGEQLEKITQYLRKSGYGYLMDDDMIMNRPVMVNETMTMEREPYPKEPVPPVTPLHATGSSESDIVVAVDGGSGPPRAYAENSPEIKAYLETVKVWKRRHEAYKEELDHIESAKKKYKTDYSLYVDWRSKEDIAQGLFETFFNEMKWAQIVSDPDYKSRPNLFTAVKVAYKAFANLRGSGK